MNMGEVARSQLTTFTCRDQGIKPHRGFSPHIGPINFNVELRLGELVLGPQGRPFQEPRKTKKSIFKLSQCIPIKQGARPPSPPIIIIIIIH